MQMSSQERRTFFDTLGVKGWRTLRDTLARPARKRSRLSLALAAATRSEARMDATAARWQHQTRDLDAVATEVAHHIDTEAGRTPDRLRRALVESWLHATLTQGDLRLVRAVVSRMAGSLLGFTEEGEVRLSSRARRVAFETLAALVADGQAHAHRGRGRAIADGHSTQGAVVYTKVQESRPLDAVPDYSRAPIMGGLASTLTRAADAVAALMRLRRAAARSETTQGPSAPVVVSSPEVTPSTGDGAGAETLA
jgi:hypothetical protein